MFVVGHNLYPCKKVLCCLNNQSSKRLLDMKVAWACGPEYGKVALTLVLMNIPLFTFQYFSFDYFFFVLPEVTENNVHKGLIIAHIILAAIANLFFVVSASTDPGIIPARSWQRTTQDIA